MEKAYLGLGGNIGNTSEVIKNAILLLEQVSGVASIELSKLYSTTPVQVIDNSSLFVNAVCRLDVFIPLEKFAAEVHQIEERLGKRPKLKNASRVIDIDILFFGDKTYLDKDLEIPHPRWQERLFVLKPLLDLTASIQVENQYFEINELVRNFKNSFNETVIPIE